MSEIKKKLIFRGMFITLIAIVALLGCKGSSDEQIDGSLPVLNLGDKWVLEKIVAGKVMTSTIEVVGNDQIYQKECYIINTTFIPPMNNSFGAMRMMIDKQTMDVLSAESLGESGGSYYLWRVRSSYQYSQPPYPVSVGKVWQVAQTDSITIKTIANTTKEIENKVYTMKVEKSEKIKVPAGIFTCFKIVEYNEKGSPVSITWISPETKFMEVKYVDHISDESTELVSYSMTR